MTLRQKALILDSLAKVKGESFVAYCVRDFVQNAHLKTDNEIVETVMNLQGQQQCNEPMLRRILGDQYDFLMSQKFSPSFQEAELIQ